MWKQTAHIWHMLIFNCYRLRSRQRCNNADSSKHGGPGSISCHWTTSLTSRELVGSSENQQNCQDQLRYSACLWAYDHEAKCTHFPDAGIVGQEHYKPAQQCCWNPSRHTELMTSLNVHHFERSIFGDTHPVHVHHRSHGTVWFLQCYGMSAPWSAFFCTHMYPWKTRFCRLGTKGRDLWQADIYSTRYKSLLRSCNGWKNDYMVPEQVLIPPLLAGGQTQIWKHVEA